MNCLDKHAVSILQAVASVVIISSNYNNISSWVELASDGTTET